MAQSRQSAGALAGYGVLVTGGGTGIGRGCAAALAADGAAVTICGRTESKLKEAAARIEAVAAGGGFVQWLVADVTDEAQVKAAVARALEPTGRLKGCVANAGGGGGMGPYPVLDTKEFLRVLHLNVLSTMLCIKHSVLQCVGSGNWSSILRVQIPYALFTVGAALRGVFRG